MIHTLVALAGLLGCRPEYGILGEEPAVARQKEERFAQQPVPLSDVLFVVDNSESMAEEQDLLAANFPAFLDWFVASEVDYHIGVVSTDLDDDAQAGKLRDSGAVRWIERSTTDAAARLAEMTRVGIAGASDERGRAAAWTALELRRDDHNRGFLRDDAFLHVIVVSDEDDQSGDDPVTVEEFTDFLRGFEDGQRRVTFSSIVGPPSHGEAFRCGAKPGFEYLDVTQAVGGVAWSICEEDWAPLLDELGFLAIGLRRVFPLADEPDLDTLQVSIARDGRETPADRWRYDETLEAVVFPDEPPPSGTLVIVRYTTWVVP